MPRLRAQACHERCMRIPTHRGHHSNLIPATLKGASGKEGVVSQVSVHLGPISPSRTMEGLDADGETVHAADTAGFADAFWGADQRAGDCP
jgi:UDP-N-acetylmuramate-alanine ligase